MSFQPSFSVGCGSVRQLLQRCLRKKERHSFGRGQAMIFDIGSLLDMGVDVRWDMCLGDGIRGLWVGKQRLVDADGLSVFGWLYSASHLS